MAEFELPCGRIVSLDDADTHLLSGRRWYSAKRGRQGRHVWYAVGRLFRTDPGILLHNLIMGSQHIDHRNGDGLDNRRSNLRPFEKGQNLMNKRSNLGRQFKGVFPARGKFYAMIGANGAYHRSRGHASPEDAAHAYDLMAIELHGEFARLNFPETVLRMLDRKDARQGELLGSAA